MNQDVVKPHGLKRLQTGSAGMFERQSSRRSFLRQIGLVGLSLAATPAWSEEIAKLSLASGPRDRPITNDFPQKRNMILATDQAATPGDPV